LISVVAWLSCEVAWLSGSALVSINKATPRNMVSTRMGDLVNHLGL